MHDRQFYFDAANRYFTAMDRGDVEGVVACFADICANSNRMAHSPTHWVVDVETGTCACELDYFDDMKDGRVYDMHNCNFSEFDATGKFSRVYFWMGRNQVS
jgi:ketosteroid isomerase-like protein